MEIKPSLDRINNILSNYHNNPTNNRELQELCEKIINDLPNHAAENLNPLILDQFFTCLSSQRTARTFNRVFRTSKTETQLNRLEQAFKDRQSSINSKIHEINTILLTYQNNPTTNRRLQALCEMLIKELPNHATIEIDPSEYSNFRENYIEKKFIGHAFDRVLRHGKTKKTLEELNSLLADKYNTSEQYIRIERTGGPCLAQASSSKEKELILRSLESNKDQKVLELMLHNLVESFNTFDDPPIKTSLMYEEAFTSKFIEVLTAIKTPSEAVQKLQKQLLYEIIKLLLEHQSPILLKVLECLPPEFLADALDEKTNIFNFFKNNILAHHETIPLLINKIIDPIIKNDKLKIWDDKQISFWFEELNKIANTENYDFSQLPFESIPERILSGIIENIYKISLTTTTLDKLEKKLPESTLKNEIHKFLVEKEVTSVLAKAASDTDKTLNLLSSLRDDLLTDAFNQILEKYPTFFSDPRNLTDNYQKIKELVSKIANVETKQKAEKFILQEETKYLELQLDKALAEKEHDIENVIVILEALHPSSLAHVFEKTLKIYPDFFSETAESYDPEELQILIDKIPEEATRSKLTELLTAETAKAEAKFSPKKGSAAPATTTPAIPPFHNTSARVLFNLLADEFGANSQLQGISPSEILAYVTSYIKEQKSLVSSFPEVVRELEMACKIYAEGLSNVLPAALAAGKPFIIPGGWIGIPAGHSVYYEAIPQADGTVNFRIFNTGAGIDDYHQIVQVGVKQKVAFVEWKGISRQRLQDPSFAKIITEMNKETDYSTEGSYLGKYTKYTAKDLYEGLKDFLKPTSTVDGLDAPLMQPQRAGTCACRSLFAFLKSKLPLREYQRMKLDLRIQALTGHLLTQKDPSISDEVQYHLIQESRAMLSRRVNKLAVNRIIGDTTLLKADEALKKADAWLNAHSIPQTTLSTDHTFSPPKNDIDVSTFLSSSLLTPSTDPQSIPIDETPISHLTSEINSYPLNNPQTFTNNIAKVTSLLQVAYDRNDYASVHFVVLNLIKKTPISEDFFTGIHTSHENLETAISNLGIVSEIFFKSSCRTVDSSVVFSENQYALTKLLFIQQQLARRRGEEISLPLHGRSITSLTGQGLDPKITEELATIHRQSTYGVPFFYDENLISDTFNFIIFNNLNIPYPLKELIERTYPEILQKIKQKNPGFDSKDIVIQKKLIFQSPDLPPWIQAIKKTLLIQEYITTAPISSIIISSAPLDLNFIDHARSDVGILGVYLPGAISSTDYKAPIKNPMIKDLVSVILEMRVLQEKDSKNLFDEKVIYSTTETDTPLSGFRKKYLSESSENTTKELLDIFSCPNYSVINALTFFTKHPELLRDPDYQQLFQMACFNLQSCNQIRNFKQQISLFLNNQTKANQIDQNLQTLAFLEHMGRYFKRYGCDTPDGTTYLIKILDEPTTLPAEKGLIYAELASSLGEKSTLTEDEAKFLLKAKGWLEYLPLPTELKNPNTEYDLKQVYSKHSEAIIKLLFPKERINTSLLNEIYTLINRKSPPEDLIWEPIGSPGMSPRFKSNHNDFYDPVSGRFTTTGLESFLPSEICNDFAFKQLYPNQNTAIVRANDTYEFTDKETRVLVKKSGSCVFIEQCKKGSSLQFIPRTLLMQENYNGTIISLLESRYLADKYEVWHSITDPDKIFLYDKKNGSIAYTAKCFMGWGYTAAITLLTRASDGAILGKPSTLLTNIEDPTYIQEWYQGDERVEVELPRFKLSFKPDKEGALQCQEHPGFFLSKDQNLSSIGSCKYALVLKNAAGKTRVLLPNQLLEGDGSSESLGPQFKRNQFLKKDDSVDFTYFSYDLMPNGYLECSSREGYIYLAQTLAVHREYEKAAHYLSSFGEKLAAYSPTEIEALKNLAKIKEVTGDTSPNQIAIALYATYLLATNEIHYPDAIKDLPDLYRHYLPELSNVTVLKLPKEEELHLIKSLLPKPLTHQFTTRIKELDPSYKEIRRSVTPQTDPLNPVQIDFKRFNRLITEEAAKSLPPNFENDLLITRPTEFIQNHLVQIIKLAIEGSPEEQEWIQKACFFVNTTEPSLAFFLEIILKNPSKFTPPPKLLDTPDNNSRKLHLWWNDISTKASLLTFRRAPSPISPLAAPIIRVAAHPTGQRPIVIPERAFIFSSEPVADLSQDTTASRWTTATSEPPSVNTQLTEFLSLQGSEDPVELAEWTRLQQDAKALSAKSPKTLYTLNKEVSEITPVLEEKKAAITEELSILETRMLKLVATEPTSPKDKALFAMKKRGGLAKEILIDDIFISLAQKDPKSLLKENPYLSQKNLNDLYQLAARYLQLSSQGAQVDRSLALCEKIKKAPTKELEQELGEQLNATRCYNIDEHPAYLVFEHYSGMILRGDQVAKLNAFLQGEISNLIMEMIMGSGKSKVLLPLLGLLRADGKALSMVVMPSALFESASSDTQAILQKTFSKSLKTLHLDRNSPFNKIDLEEIKSSLETIIKEKQCLIMTPKSIQTLILKLVEFANSLKPEDKAKSEELKLLIEILTLLKKTGNPLIDEVDTILNVRHEVSFSLGEKVDPNPEEIHLIGILYQILYSDPKLKEIARLESDPHPNPTAPPLSEELYHEKLKRPLAIALANKLIEQGKLREVDRVIILAYLCHDESQAVLAQIFFQSQSPEVKNLLALAAEELDSLLPHTLLKTSDERYGLDQGVLAIPFEAANTPSHGSLFSNRYITMNYTYQIHAKNGIEENTIVGLIHRLRKKADSESGSNQIELAETVAYKEFCLLIGELKDTHAIPFRYDISSNHLKLILERINSNPKVRQDLIEKLFLPEMQLFENKISCNPINLTSIFSRVSGFTGTLWNAGSMNASIQARPEAGTDAKTINLLMGKCTGPAIVIPKITGDTMFNRLPTHDAIIDAGGYFKEGGNLAIARKMAIEYKKPVVFYNSQGVQTITDGRTETPMSTSPLKEDERLTLYDQSHTTGSDIKQKEQALGLVTVGREMLLRDLLQSVWRFRGLEHGQTVQFVMDEEVESIIKAQLHLGAEEKIGFKEILKFVIQNQAAQQGDDNFKAFKQQLDNLSQNLLLEILTSEDYTADQKSEAITELSCTWIKPANQTPSELYGKPSFERPSQDVIKETAEKCKAQLDAFSRRLPFLKPKIDALKAEIPKFQIRAKASVHPRIISPLSDTDSSVEVEQSTQLEVSTAIETEGNSVSEAIQLGAIRARFWNRYTDISFELFHNPYCTPIFPLSSQMSREPGLKSYMDLFEGIDISANILEWKAEETGLIDKIRFLGPHRIPFHHLLIEPAYNYSAHYYEKPQSIEENVTLYSQLEDITDSPNYYNLSLGFKDPERKLSPKAFEKVVKLKFLNGQSDFKEEELKFLQTWFTSPKAGAAKMQKLYLEHIIKGQPDKQLAYSGSNLQILFHRLTRKSSH
ncbi:MAG: DUF3638 domain-containing protein [Chlamydiae bacterium]|nr:DUF3638 domain-containing protein [Chlamydiota bacterium]